MNNWIIQDPQGSIYILQEAYSSYVYANNGEQVFSLDGSSIQFGYFRDWEGQTIENSSWVPQGGG